MKRGIFSIAAFIFCLLFVLSGVQNIAAQEPAFLLFQSIPTGPDEAFDAEFFTIDGVHYLAVANWRNGADHDINSKIYGWDDATQEFVLHQPIATYGARNLEYFSIDSDHYLAVANGGNPYIPDINVNSKIYKWVWNDTELKYKFEEFQAILTHEAADWEFFTIGSEHYLVVANDNDGTTLPGGFSTPIDSIIYHWNGSSFVEFQRILTEKAIDWEFFTIGGTHYLTVTNHQQGALSKIYMWNGSQFVWFQDLSTSQPTDQEFFTIDGNHYLAVSNSFPLYQSEIYKWNGSQFISFQSISTDGYLAGGLESFTMNSDYYLVVCHNATAASKIYQWSGSQFTEFQSIPTNFAGDWEFFTINSEHYLALSDRTNETTKIYTFDIYLKLVDWNLNVTPTYLDDTAFDLETGRGAITLRYEPGAAGDYSIEATFNYLFSSTYPDQFVFSENTVGTPESGQLLGINFVDHGINADVTATLGWDFSLASDTDWAEITFILGDTTPEEPYSVFSYTHTSVPYYDPASYEGQLFASSTIEVVPEPATILLLGCGLLGLFAFARKRRIRGK